VDGDILRVRMNLLVSGGTLSTFSQAFKLQYASTTGACTSSLSWIDASRYSLDPDPKKGSGTFDSCGTQNSADYIDYVQINSSATDTLHVKIKWWPSSDGTYTENNGIHLKAFHYDGSTWREAYSHLMGSFATEDCDQWYYDEFDYTIPSTSTAGTNYIRAAIIDRSTASAQMDPAVHCACASCDDTAANDCHYDNDDVSFTVTDTKWIGYDNPTSSDGATIGASDYLLSSSAVAESYEEYNPSEKNPRAIPQDGQGEWDWVIQDDGAPGGVNYSFRMVKSDGSFLDTYNSDGYPRLTTAGVGGIDISGKVYTDEGQTTTTATTTVSLAVNSTKTATTSITNGSYTFPNVTSTASDIITVFWDTDDGDKAVVVTKGASANITDLHLYQNRVIVRHEGTSSLTIADMAKYDSSDDTDVLFTAATSTTDTLQVDAEAKLYIWPEKTFAPGGNVTLKSGGSGDSWDGSLKICSTSTFTATGTESYSIGGSWFASSTATFNAASSTVTFTATTTGKTITTAGNAFWNLIFNGSGGSWEFQDAVTTTNNLTLTEGTASSTYNISVLGGNATGTNGTINMTGGTFLLDGTGNFGANATWTFYNLKLGDGSGTATTSKIGTGNIEVTNVLTIESLQTLNASSTSWTLSGNTSTPFSLSGTFNAQSSTFIYKGDNSGGNTNIASTTYYNLQVNNATETYDLTGNTTTTNNLNITNGTLDVTANNYNLWVAGNWTNNGTFTAGTATVYFNATTTGKTIDPGNYSFYDVTFNNASGGWTIIADATSTHNWSITNATSFVATSSITIEVQGEYNITTSTPSSTDWKSGSTLYLNGTSQTIGNKNQSKETYATLKIGANTDIRMWNSTSSNYIVDSSGSLYSQNHGNISGYLYVWGDYHTTSTDYWSYGKDFDGTTGVNQQCKVYIQQNATITIDSGGTLNVKGGETTSTDKTIVGQGATTSWSFACLGTCNIQESAWNWPNFNNGTTTVLNTFLNGESVTSSATLNVDWYLV